jgi:hypothetical protein
MKSKDRPVLWEPTEKQREFLACPAREALFAGSVGSGKTDAILMAGLSQVNNPRHSALILRRSFPMLRDLIGRSHELFLPLGATFNKQESAWTFPSKARLEFGFLYELPAYPRRRPTQHRTFRKTWRAANVSAMQRVEYGLSS